MTSNDEFHVKERITALHEAYKKPVTSRSLGLYWEALKEIGIDDFNAAIVRAMQSGALGANEIRVMAREAARERVNRGKPPEGVFYCRAHEEHPDVVSANPTMDWCPQCRHFVSTGQQEPDAMVPLPVNARGGGW